MRLITKVFYIFIVGLIVSCTSNSNDSAKETADVPAQKVKNFDYSPLPPENGELYGVIEMGGSGFNSFVVQIDENGNWKLEKATFGESKVYEGEASLDEISKGLQEYIEAMLADGIGSDKIHFIQSSTARENERVQEINKALKGLGYAVNSVDVETEGQYAFTAIMPKIYASNSFIMDIGSGNTKVSWMENGEIKGFNFQGSKYYLDGESDEEVYRQVASKLNQIPAANTKYCFLIGGAPFKLAKLDDTYYDRYAPLKAPDFYTSIEDPKTLAGLNIYKAFYDNLPNCEAYVFDWDGNFSIGFLLNFLEI